MEIKSGYAGQSDDFKKFNAVLEPLSIPLNEQSKAARDKEWEMMGWSDQISFEEFDGWVQTVLQDSYEDEGKRIGQAFRPSYICAFEDASAIAKGNDDYITQREFRVALAYLTIYGNLYDAFASIDGVEGTDDDCLDFSDFKQATGALKATPFVAFTAKSMDGKEQGMFHKINTGPGSLIVFKELCRFVEKAEKKAGTKLGELISLGELEIAKAEAEKKEEKKEEKEKRTFPTKKSPEKANIGNGKKGKKSAVPAAQHNPKKDEDDHKKKVKQQKKIDSLRANIEKYRRLIKAGGEGEQDDSKSNQTRRDELMEENARVREELTHYNTQLSRALQDRQKKTPSLIIEQTMMIDGALSAQILELEREIDTLVHEKKRILKQLDQGEQLQIIEMTNILADKEREIIQQLDEIETRDRQNECEKGKDLTDLRKAVRGLRAQREAYARAHTQGQTISRAYRAQAVRLKEQIALGGYQGTMGH